MSKWRRSEEQKRCHGAHPHDITVLGPTSRLVIKLPPSQTLPVRVHRNASSEARGDHPMHCRLVNRVVLKENVAPNLEGSVKVVTVFHMADVSHDEVDYPLDLAFVVALTQRVAKLVTECV